MRQPQMIEPIKSSMVLEKSLSLISLLLFSCYIGWVVSAIELVKVFNGLDLGMDKKVLATQIIFLQRISSLSPLFILCSTRMDMRHANSHLFKISRSILFIFLEFIVCSFSSRLSFW